jgi:uncharacterized membrane protein
MKNNTTTQLSPHVDFARAAKHPSGNSGRATRIISFDLARGFTVFCMPMIHVVMLYSTIPVQQSLLGDILGFTAEGPGAQLFMLLMGVFFALQVKPLSTATVGGGRQNKWLGKEMRSVCKRALLLFIAAYALNIFKFIIPLGLGILPENLLQELQLKNDFTSVPFFFFIGDILHFAAIAYIILYFITRTRYYPYISLVLAIAIMFLSPYLWDQQTGIAAIDYVIVLFNGHPPQTFFPVFPWLVYPLMGLTLGYLLKHINNNYLIKKTGISGIGIMIISFCFPATDTSQPTTYLPFYRTEPADTLFHAGFVLVWLSIFHWLSKKIPPNHLFRLLTFCSKNITSIYIIQWILICWCMAFTGYLQLNMTQTVCWMTGITIITLLLTYALKKSPRNSQLTPHN